MQSVTRFLKRKTRAFRKEYRMSSQDHGAGRVQLDKSMSPLAIWALAFGSIIGWGAFVMPGLRFLPSSGPLAACIGFAIGGIMLMFVAISYGKIVGMYPVAGGAFAFAYAIFGSTAAFICGWAMVLGYLSIIALNATALVLMTRFLIPGVLEFGYLYTIADWNIFVGELIFLEAVLIIFGFLNMRGADLVSKIQVALAVTLGLGVVALCAGAFTADTTAITNLQPYFAENRSWIASVAAVVAVAPWLYVGFDTIPQAAEEFNFTPEKAVKLMLIAIVCGIVVYSLVTIAVGIVIPYPELIKFNPVWHTGYIADLALGRWGTLFLALAVLSGILTGINGFYVAGSRLLFSMGRARILPEWFSHLDSKHHTPSNALGFIMVIVFIAPFFGREVLAWVVDMSSIGTIIAYLFASYAAYKILSQMKGESNGMLVTCAILGCVSSLICLGLLTIPYSPASIGMESWAALLVWVLLGVAFYCLRLDDVRNFPQDERTYLILGDSELTKHVHARNETKANK